MLYLKNISLNQIINTLFCLFPISFIIGSLFVTLNLYLFLILSFFYIKKKNYKFNFDYTNNILIGFFLLIIISSLLNIETIKENFVFRSILLFRFAILYLIIEILLINNQLNLKNFFFISLFSTSFISFDIIIQYIFDFDLFGYKPWAGSYLTGVFVDEAIAGAYIQKFSLLSFFGLLFLIQEKRYKKQLLFIVILLHLIGVLFANNKMPAIILLSSVILLFLFDKKIRSTAGSSIVVFILLTIVLISNDKNLQAKYMNIYNHFFLVSSQTDATTELAGNASKTEPKKKVIFSISHNDYSEIYFTVIKSWKDNPVIGWGHKSFRIKCHDVIKEKKSEIPLRCSTHPHNYLLEILHDYGLIGLTLITSFIFITLFHILKKLKTYALKERIYAMFFIPIVISLLFEIWPIRTTGSLFTTWNGTAVWLIVAISVIVKKKFSQKNLVSPSNNNTSFLIIGSLGFLMISLIIKRFVYHYYSVGPVYEIFLFFKNSFF